MKIYTRTGDDGTTSLVGGQRVSKKDARLDAYGTVDELNSFIGLMQSFLDVKAETSENILWIQQKLFNIGGCLATDSKTTTLPETCRILQTDVERLEQFIDAAGEGLPQQRTLFFPGAQAASYAHVPECLSSAEDSYFIKDRIEIPSTLLAFINRLSDYLFVLARRINYLSRIEEKTW